MNITTLPIISTARLLHADGELNFKFEELGLEIEGGFSAGMFNGTAHVTYWDTEDGLEWFVGDITLDCSRWNGKSHDVKQVTLSFEPNDQTFLGKLYLQIYEVLTEGSFKDFVQAKVEEQS